MIISRTPLRASFCGGGTDIDSFSKTEESGGKVVSLAIDKYIHVLVNKRFDERVRVSYSSLELVDDFEDLKHELVREAMRVTGVTSGVEITTIADIPSRGTGLGSSSTVTVGLLNALHKFAGHDASPAQLAEEACLIEIDILGQPIGRQDQYAAAFGGINAISFDCKEVRVEPIIVSCESQIRDEFTLVFTGLSRSASEVLSEAPTDPNNKLMRLRKIRNQADTAEQFLNDCELSKLGILIGEAWNEKRGISAGVSGNEIDSLHDEIIELGASGAKLLGAGGGGFFLVHGEKDLRDRLRQLHAKNRLIPLGIDDIGSTIIFEG
tara:strand:+ start:4901 stop:5869 length:969 start_codon:yes stop_codon:yes gene_type:complete